MKPFRIYIILAAAVLIGIVLAFAFPPEPRPQRQLRRQLVEADRLYLGGEYAKAEVEYRKALEIDSTNVVGRFNLAASLLRQANGQPEGMEFLNQAEQILKQLAFDRDNKAVASLAAYNLGNISYNKDDLDGAIQWYKVALRANPDDDLARENLRYCQLKKRDENQDQQQQQQQQDQQQQEQQQDEQQQPQQQQPQPQGGLSDQSAEQILKAMENAEAETLREIQRRQQQQHQPPQTSRPW